MAPAGNISVVERHQRLNAIKELVEEGYTDGKIADKLGIAISTVKRNRKYLEELKTADLTPQQVAEKRAELELELIEATEKAKTMFESSKNSSNYRKARTWFMSWMEAVKLRMQLYGLDSVKVESFTQINTLNQYVEPDTVDMETGEKIARLLKKSHEKKYSVQE